MSRHQIDYESLAQDAMRGLVRTVMQRIAKTGLPGDHHFYISFHTRGAGATLSKRLLERYPEEMTIVLQNKFWDFYDLVFENQPRCDQCTRHTLTARVLQAPTINAKHMYVRSVGENAHAVANA